MQTDINPNFDWRTLRDVIVIIAIAYYVLLLFSSCKSHKVAENTTNSDVLSALSIERVYERADILRADSFFRDKVLTIILNEKGDTVKTSERVCVRERSDTKEKQYNIKEKRDSTTHDITSTHTEVVENEPPWWRRFIDTSAKYIIIWLIVILGVLVVRFRMVK